MNGGRGGYGGGGQRNFSGGGGRHGRPQERPQQVEAEGPTPELMRLISRVNLSDPTAELFDDVAKGIADILKQPRDQNKSSQLRRFYDDIIRFADRHKSEAQSTAEFARDLPFIRMIAAHAAYAQTRKHVDANFTAFIQNGIRQVKTPYDLHMLRTLFEAVIGFSPKKN